MPWIKVKPGRKINTQHILSNYYIKSGKAGMLFLSNGLDKVLWQQPTQPPNTSGNNNTHQLYVLRGKNEPRLIGLLLLVLPFVLSSVPQRRRKCDLSNLGRNDLVDVLPNQPHSTIWQLGWSALQSTQQWNTLKHTILGSGLYTHNPGIYIKYQHIQSCFATL